MKLSLFTYLTVFFFLSLNLNAQIKIQGYVTGSNGEAIGKASIAAYGEDKGIIAYNYSLDSGKFLVNIENDSVKFLIVTANSLGYFENVDTLTIFPFVKNYSVTFKLKEKVELLNEVVLQSTQKISTNGNVTTLQTGAFTDQTEQTVEDVLKKLPGIEVLENGSIKAHGKFIDKLLIDGEDMFANDYQVLSKNLDAKVLSSVQIYDKFQDNPVLARVLKSDRVALNLQLKEEFKNIWFGNISSGLGTKERVKASANIGLLKKKIKFFYFGNYNNLGYKASDQLEGAPSSLNITSVYQEKKIEPTIVPLYSIDKNENNYFKEGQSTFNKAFLNSLGFVTKLSPNIDIRGTGFFTNDIQNQFFSSETIYNVEQDPISFSENSDTYHNNTIGSGELELKYTGGERSYIKNIMTYQNQPEKFNNNLLFNNDNIYQTLKKTELSFYNHFNYSYVLDKDQVFHNYIYIGQNNINQNLNIQSPILNKLFSLPNNSKIYNFSDDELSTFGISSNLFSNFGDFHHRMEISYESLEEKRKNRFITGNSGSSIQIDSLQNHSNFDQKKIKLKTSLSYSFSEKVELSLGFSVEHLKIKTLENSKREWLFNPEIGLDLRKMKIGRFKFSYENNYRSPESSILLKNYQLNSYRSFIQGAENIFLIKRDLYNFYYKWANELESQSISFRFKYDIANGNYSTSNQISQDLTRSKYSFVDSGELISSSFNYSSFYDKLHISTNIKTTQNWSKTPIQINSSGLKILKNYSSSYQLSGTTYFKGPINFGFDINLNFSESQFNDVVSKTQWENAGLNLTYSLSKEFKASFNNVIYRMENDSYYFMDSTFSYQPKESDFSYQINMNNLTNENSFSTTVIDDYIIYTSEVKLLPRYIFVSAKYRF